MNPCAKINMCIIVQILKYANVKCQTFMVPLTTGTLKMRDLKMRHQTAGVENAGLENAGNDIVWNAAHCLCLLSFAGSNR